MSKSFIAHTNGGRATETEVLQLLDWAKSGHDRTIHQGTRPALIIVVNKDAPSTDENWLDVDFATAMLLSQLELADSFTELRELWRSRGKNLQTAADLILCYYDSFRVLCIPTLIPTTVVPIARQHRQLHQEIQFASARVRSKKAQLGVHPDVATFGAYVEHAFNRLGRDLRNAIDFFYLARHTTSRLPSVFKEHFLGLLVSLQTQSDATGANDTGQEVAILERLLPYIARAITLVIRTESDPRRSRTSP